MTTGLRLRKKSFLIMTKQYDHIDGKGAACYKPVLRYVSGDVFTYLDHKWGIYRKEHTTDRKRKNDYVMVDLSTGLTVRVDSRRINILDDLETAWLRQVLRDIINAPDYEKHIKQYERLKRGGVIA